MDTEDAATALDDAAYYQAIVEHRRHMIFKTSVDYDTHQPEMINFIPPDGVMEAFEKDYVLMREQMIYDENSKNFGEIIAQLKTLLEAFRKV